MQLATNMPPKDVEVIVGYVEEIQELMTNDQAGSIRQIIRGEVGPTSHVIHAEVLMEGGSMRVYFHYNLKKPSNPDDTNDSIEIEYPNHVSASYRGMQCSFVYCDISEQHFYAI